MKTVIIDGIPYINREEFLKEWDKKDPIPIQYPKILEFTADYPCNKRMAFKLKPDGTYGYKDQCSILDDSFIFKSFINNNVDITKVAKSETEIFEIGDETDCGKIIGFTVESNNNMLLATFDVYYDCKAYIFGKEKVYGGKRHIPIKAINHKNEDVKENPLFEKIKDVRENLLSSKLLPIFDLIQTTWIKKQHTEINDNEGIKNCDNIIDNAIKTLEYILK